MLARGRLPQRNPGDLRDWTRWQRVDRLGHGGKAERLEVDGRFASQNIPFDPNFRINIANDGHWGLTISCVTIYGTTYYDKRGDGASGGWSGWYG